MRRPVACSTVRTSSSGPPPSGPPPFPYAELIFALPLPGMSTIESRGMLTSVVGPLPVCSSMIVSVSWETSSPVAYFSRSSGVSFCLLSEPTISQFVPFDEFSLDEGSAFVLLSVESTYTPNATTSSNSTRSATPMRRPHRGRRGLRMPGGRTGRRGGPDGRPRGGPDGSTAVRCSGRRGGGGGGWDRPQPGPRKPPFMLSPHVRED